MISNTSLKVFFEKILPTLGHRQRLVFGELTRVGESTNKELANLLHCDPCSVTGRVKELRDRNLVILHCERQCRVTGEKVKCWQANPNPVTRISEVREVEKPPPVEIRIEQPLFS